MIRIDRNDVRVVQLAQWADLSERSEGSYLACDHGAATQTPEHKWGMFLYGQRLRMPDSNLLNHLLIYFNNTVKLTWLKWVGIFTFLIKLFLLTIA